VDLVDAAFRVVPLELGADYTVAGLGRDQGGAVTLTAPGLSKAGTGLSLVMRRRMDFTQETDYRPHDVFPAETHERALDILTMICQELREMMSRALIAPPNVNEPIQYSDLAALYERTLAAMNKTLAALQEMTDSGFILRPATAERLGGVIIGDGLGVDAAGRASVDFSKMPTDKFEAMLKSIRVNIWLTANKTWYVNAATGDDDNDGETAGTAFKTITRAVNNIADSYFLAGVTATIEVAAGTYDENVVIPNISNRNGGLQLRGAGPTTVIQGILHDMSSAFVGCFDLALITLEKTERAVFCESNKALRFTNVSFTAKSDLTAVIDVSGHGRVLVYAGCSIEIATEAKVGYAIRLGTFGLMQMAGGWTINGVVTATIQVSACGAFFRLSTSDSSISGAVTGRRYDVRTGGHIVTQGCGPNFFPGTTAGTADAATGGFYS
jgi:hypothetical protein